MVKSNGTFIDLVVCKDLAADTPAAVEAPNDSDDNVLLERRVGEGGRHRRGRIGQSAVPTHGQDAPGNRRRDVPS